eukprot:9328-Heterococcus_DN1.PRE.5
MRGLKVVLLTSCDLLASGLHVPLPERLKPNDALAGDSLNSPAFVKTEIYEPLPAPQTSSLATAGTTNDSSSQSYVFARGRFSLYLLKCLPVLHLFGAGNARRLQAAAGSAVWYVKGQGAQRELRAATGGSDFQSLSASFNIALEGQGSDWQFGMASNGDLFSFLQATNTQTTEIHVLSKASGWTSFSLQTTTIWPLCSTCLFLVAQNNRDMVIIKKQNTGTSSTEIHFVSAASGYQSYTNNRGTPLPEQTGNVFQFALAPDNNDLFAIKTADASTGSTEVHILSAASNYQSWSLQMDTPWPLDRGVRSKFQVLPNRDILIALTGTTDTHTTEMHILSASSNYRQYALNVGTPIPESDMSYTFLTGSAASVAQAPACKFTITTKDSLILNLAEVAIYNSVGSKIQPSSASLSSTYPTYDTDKCLDGNTQTFCHTRDGDTAPTLTVKWACANSVTTGYTVKVTNRVDGSTEPLRIIGGVLQSYNVDGSTSGSVYTFADNKPEYIITLGSTGSAILTTTNSLVSSNSVVGEAVIGAVVGQALDFIIKLMSGPDGVTIHPADFYLKNLDGGFSAGGSWFYAGLYDDNNQKHQHWHYTNGKLWTTVLLSLNYCLFSYDSGTHIDSCNIVSPAKLWTLEPYWDTTLNLTAKSKTGKPLFVIKRTDTVDIFDPLRGQCLIRKGMEIIVGSCSVDSIYKGWWIDGAFPGV